MNQKVRSILDQIDEVLCDGSTEARQLWDILSALRGPDNDDAMLKDATTSVIRAKAFPKTKRTGSSDSSIGTVTIWNLGAIYADDTAGAQQRRQTSAFVGTHFISHMRTAFVALGLQWNSLNK